MLQIALKRVVTSLVLGLFSFLFFNAFLVGGPNLQIQYQATKSTAPQVFFDTGTGFIATQSSRQNYFTPNRWANLNFSLPTTAIAGLRFDPADTSGEFRIRNIRILDSWGLEIAKIPITAVQPGPQINTVAVSRGSLAIATLPNAVDPQLFISLDRNLKINVDGFVFGRLLDAALGDLQLLIFVGMWLLTLIVLVDFKIFSKLSSLPTSAHDDDRYFGEIDGLRAVAVLSVLLFHLEIEFLPGGYLGVDIFFVISGFLITRLIIFEYLSTGRFRFGDFYLRRARRLFPAFFVTIIITLVGAVLLFEPSDLERTGGSALHALASVANFFFWTEAGYFDTDSNVKPLLHTWSLSVEEQFYLLWPLLLVFLMRTNVRCLAGLLLVLLCGTSLYLRFLFSDGGISLSTELNLPPPLRSNIEGWFADGRATIFYLLPFRFFELGLGAAMVWIVGRSPLPNFVRELILGIGLCLIIWSFISIDAVAFVDPLKILVPVIGTCLIIFAGGTKFLGALLRNSPMIYLGLISYSLYLIHWPLIVLMRYYNFGSLSGTEQIMAAVLSIAFASIMYKFVERPWRRLNPNSPGFGSAPNTSTTPNSTFAISIFGLSLLIALPSASIWKFDGWGWRYPEAIREILLSGPARRHESWDAVGRWGSAEFDEEHHKILIIGDSHSKDLWNALWYSDFEKDMNSLRRLDFDEGCIPLLDSETDKSVISVDQQQRCTFQVDRFFSWPRLKESESVIITFRWTQVGIDGLDLVLDALKHAGFSGQVAIFGRTVEFTNFPRLIARFGTLDKEELGRYVASHRDTTIGEINQRLEHEVIQRGITYLSKDHYICDGDYSSCTALVNENTPLIYDYGHWTVPGAQYIGEKMMQDVKFNSFINRP